MTINKITELFPKKGIPLNQQLIQEHLDENNTLGWNLVAVDNLNGGYRFFWAKVE